MLAPAFRAAEMAMTYASSSFIAPAANALLAWASMQYGHLVMYVAATAQRSLVFTSSLPGSKTFSSKASNAFRTFWSKYFETSLFRFLA
ncbi:MAG: hypothetical protein ABSA11_11990 [Candidatus Bathyarchaeia archaeon]|jgi:hypothetical protein